MLDMLQPFSTSISVDAWLALIGCCAEVSCQYRILKHREISGGPRQISSGVGIHICMVSFSLTIAALHIVHFATQLSWLIMDGNHFCSTLFFSCPTNRASFSCSVREIFGRFRCGSRCRTPLSVMIFFSRFLSWITCFYTIWDIIGCITEELLQLTI